MLYIISFAIAFTIYRWPAWLQLIFSLLFMLTVSQFHFDDKQKHYYKKLTIKMIKRLRKRKANQKKH